MPRQEECRYTREHEWVHIAGTKAVMGITDFAQGELGDIVYLSLGETGRAVQPGDEIGEIESVKAVAEFYAPLAGTIVETNGLLADHPEKVNQDPFGDGWLVKLDLSDPASAAALMDYAAYRAYLEESAH